MNLDSAVAKRNAIISELKEVKTFNRRMIMRRAWWIKKQSYMMTLSEALKQAWEDTKEAKQRILSDLFEELRWIEHKLLNWFTPRKDEVKSHNRMMQKIVERGIKVTD